MKNLAIILASCAISLSIPSFSEAHEDTIMCTMEYAPVCGVKDGVYRTYGNNCTLGAEKATFVHQGECREDGQAPTYVPPASCTAWFDGCNSCSKDANGMTACTLRACVGKPAAGYCTAYEGTPAVTKPTPDTGSVSSPVNNELAPIENEVAVEATTTTETEVGFFTRIWTSIVSFFGGLF